jgi:GT2 family glycosyltransferase
VSYWNDLGDLERCLGSIYSSGVAAILFNNAPEDRAPARVAERYGALLVSAARNLGFCEAVNRSLAWVKTEYVLLLNPDAFVGPSFIGCLIESLDRDGSLGAVGGRLLRAVNGRPTDFVDSLGIEIRPGRRPADIGHGRQAPTQIRGSTEVFGVTAAAAMYRMSALRQAAVGREVLPSQYFMYMDDVDLAWRLRRLGYRSAIVLDAVAFHGRTVAGERVNLGSPLAGLYSRVRAEVNRPAYIRRLSWSNQLLMLIRNDEPDRLLRALPQVLLKRLPSDILMIIQAPRIALSARMRFIRLLPWAVRQRRRIRQTRAIHANLEGWLH